MGYVASVSSSVSSYEPITTSGEVSFSGLGNGTDFSEIIDATIESESYLKDEYEEQVEETEYIIDLLELLEEEIDDLNTTLKEMDEPDEFYSMSGSSTNDAVEVDVDGEADVGTHTIIVDQLALNDVWMNTEYGFSSEETVVTDTATTLELEQNGETISVSVPAGTTLEGLVDLVNADIDASGNVEADLMYDGSEYFFVLKSEDAGADNVIAITDTGDLDGFDLSNFTNTQTGQNSRIKVDGFPTDTDSWIERDSNSIDDVIDGITFDLQETTDGEEAIISVSYDTDEMADTISTFIESVNQIILDIQVLTGRVTEEEDEDVDDTYTIDSYAMDIIYGEIKSILSTGALGFSRYDEETGGDTYNALSQIGIYTDTDEGSDTFGQLLIDDDELEEALDNDPEAVAMMFCATGIGESDSDDFQVISVIDTVTPAGEHTVEYTISGEISSATIDGEDATISGWTLLGTDSSNSGLYISVGTRDDGTYSGTARVKQGKVGELSDTLDSISDEETGTLAILIEHYEESLTSLENQIYNEEKRLDTLETRLTQKYATLDSTLSYYDTLTSTLETLLEQLD